MIVRINASKMLEKGFTTQQICEALIEKLWTKHAAAERRRIGQTLPPNVIAQLMEHARRMFLDRQYDRLMRELPLVIHQKSKEETVH